MTKQITPGEYAKKHIDRLYCIVYDPHTVTVVDSKDNVVVYPDVERVVEYTPDSPLLILRRWTTNIVGVQYRQEETLEVDDVDSWFYGIVQLTE